MAVTHHTAILALRAILERRPVTELVEQARTAKTPNAGILRYELRAGMFHTAGSAAPTIRGSPMSVVFFNGPVQNGDFTFADRLGKAVGIRIAEALNTVLGTPPVPHLWNTTTLASAWKVRAVGQGYSNDLAGMAIDFGIVVDDPGPQSASVVGPPADTAGARAVVSLDKIRSAAPGLVDLYTTAAQCLREKGISHQRGAVYLVMDHSGSMGWFYENGTMQHLAEQVLGLAANLDDDGSVPLAFFSGGVDLVADITLDNHVGRVQALHSGLDWGGTSFVPAMRAVIEHYRASGSQDPAFVVFQTDGEPWDRRETRELLRESSRLPIFWQFVGFGHSRDLRFLRSLDTLQGRRIDNAGYFGAGQQPERRSDAKLYDCLMKEFPSWLASARAAGILQ
ncbi:VWA domain-containing protein [Embleya sp. NPDC001921]